MYSIVAKSTVDESTEFFVKLMKFGGKYNVKYSPDSSLEYAWFTFGRINDLDELHAVTSELNTWPETHSFNVIEE